MLVLSRRTGQAIRMPDLGIRVKVLGPARSTTRLGIEAPPDVLVLRDEVADAGPRPTLTPRRAACLLRVAVRSGSHAADHDEEYEAIREALHVLERAAANVGRRSLVTTCFSP